MTCAHFLSQIYNTSHKYRNLLNPTMFSDHVHLPDKYESYLTLPSPGFFDVPKPGGGASRPPLYKISISYGMNLKLGTDNIQSFFYKIVQKNRYHGWNICWRHHIMTSHPQKFDENRKIGIFGHKSPKIWKCYDFLIWREGSHQYASNKPSTTF